MKKSVTIITEEVPKIPDSGQFVAVWEYEGVLWSGTFCWIHSVLYECDLDGHFTDLVDLKRSALCNGRVKNLTIFVN